MQILQVVASANRRGAEVFGVELGARLRACGHQVDELALGPALPGTPSLEIAVASANGRLSPAVAARLRAVAKNADVVVGHGSRGLLGGTLSTLGTDTPFVYRNIGDPRYWTATLLRRWRVGIQLRRATRVVALWPSAKTTLVQRYGLEASKVRVIPRGVPAERFPPTSDDIRRRRRQELCLDETPVVAYVGSFTAEKRVRCAVEAVAQIPRATLVLAGDGPQRGELEALAATVLPGRTRFLGAVADPSPVMQAADVLVLPSASEGTAGVLVEAGLTGIPCVATDVGGTSFLVQDGEGGVLVPAGSEAVEVGKGLRLALDDRDRLGGMARKRCLERFTLDTVGAAWETVLVEVANG
ncbi:MAG TPA: glycosyltransferase family 4 protein [Acidimicrobiales bacterium]|nr:glycosyltransferase family 4 protein [Acidimicrobiales bacterium]